MIFRSYRENPTVAERNRIAEHFLPDCTRMAQFLFNRKAMSCPNLREEFLGEAPITLLKAVECYNPQMSDNFAIYLYVCLHRRLRRMMKVARCRQAFDSVGTFGDEYTPEPVDTRPVKEVEEKSELMAQAEQFLGKELVKARFVEGLSFEETGARLGVSRSTVLNRIHMFATVYKRGLSRAS